MRPTWTDRLAHMVDHIVDTSSGGRRIDVRVGVELSPSKCAKKSGHYLTHFLPARPDAAAPAHSKEYPGFLARTPNEAGDVALQISHLERPQGHPLCWVPPNSIAPVKQRRTLVETFLEGGLLGPLSITAISVLH
jgi:hypothetical protein